MEHFVKCGLLFLGGFALGRVAAKALARKAKRNCDYLVYGRMSGNDFDGECVVVIPRNY